MSSSRDIDTDAHPYFLFETGIGLCAVASGAVCTRIENATVVALPSGGPRFDSAVVQSPRQVVPAIDLRARRDAQPHDAAHGPDVLVLRQNRNVGLIVDRVVGMLSLAPRQIFPLNEQQREQLPEHVAAVAFIEGQPVAIVDPEHLCAEDEQMERDVVSRRLDRRKSPRSPRTGETPATA